MHGLFWSGDRGRHHSPGNMQGTLKACEMTCTDGAQTEHKHTRRDALRASFCRRFLSQAIDDTSEEPHTATKIRVLTHTCTDTGSHTHTHLGWLVTHEGSPRRADHKVLGIYPLLPTGPQIRSVFWTSFWVRFLDPVFGPRPCHKHSVTFRCRLVWGPENGPETGTANCARS